MLKHNALERRLIKFFPFQFGRRTQLVMAEAMAHSYLLVADRSPYRVHVIIVL